MAPLNRRKRIGIALGGGFARGFAHIGVLRVLEEYGIPIDYISGTSSGSIIAALYAATGSTKNIQALSFRINLYTFTALQLSSKGLTSSKSIENYIRKNIQEDDFKKMKIPIAIPATDLLSGKSYIFNKGSVAKAVRCSCSFPGIYIPVDIPPFCFVDGGIMNVLPIQPLIDMGAEIIIAVDVIPNTILANTPHMIVGIADRCIDLLLKQQINSIKNKIDIYIEPISDNIMSFDLHRKNDLIQMGEKATRAIIETIRDKCSVR